LGSAVDFNLYLITDRKQTRGDLCRAVEDALRGGVRAVQLREKDLSSRDLYQLALALRRITAGNGAKLFINDRLDIAMAVAADGVHLGERSLPAARVRELAGDRFLIGVSCHGLDGALSAQDGGADFITFGPVFHTPSKACYGEPLGLEPLEKACRSLGIPVFAIGGIVADGIRLLSGRGAGGVALISAILAASDPEEAARELLAALNSGLPGGRKP
jgi:thiamine-phosphate pyrophosphorylase